MSDFETELDALLAEAGGTETPANPAPLEQEETPNTVDAEVQPETPEEEVDVTLEEMMSYLGETDKPTVEQDIVRRLMTKYNTDEAGLLSMLTEAEADTLMEQHNIPEGTDPTIAKRMLELEEQVKQNNAAAARQEKQAKALEVAQELATGTDATNKQIGDYMRENFKESYLDNPDTLAMFKQLATNALKALNVPGGNLDATNPIGSTDPSLAGRQVINDPASMIANLDRTLGAVDFKFTD